MQNTLSLQIVTLLLNLQISLSEFSTLKPPSLGPDVESLTLPNTQKSGISGWRRLQMLLRFRHHAVFFAFAQPVRDQLAHLRTWVLPGV
jgi:hypothetical protein